MIMKETIQRIFSSGLAWFAAGFLFTGAVAFARYEPAPACAISLDKMNVFYIGVDNPITVLVTGVAQEEIQLDIQGSGAALEKKDDMHYNVRVTTPGDARITVSWKGEAMQRYRYNVRRIPDPVLRLGGKHKSGQISSSTFKAQTGLSILLENFDYDLTCNLVGYDVVRAPRNGDPKALTNKGLRFSQEVLQLVQRAMPGDVYYFNKARAGCPGDLASRELGDLEFVIE